MFLRLSRLDDVKWAKLLHIAFWKVQGYTLISDLSGSACSFLSYPCSTEVMFGILMIVAQLNLSLVSFTGNTA